MNKKEFAAKVAEKTGLTKTDSDKVISVIFDEIKECLKAKDSFVLLGFGTFSTVEKPARTGINPSTKQPIDIPAKTAVKFKAAKGILS